MFKRFLSNPSSSATTRNLTYQEIIEALQQSGCALCHLAQHKSRRYLETLLDSAVIDVEQRDAWRNAKGLCHWHARLAPELPHSAGSLAILYQDLLQHEIQRLAVLTSSMRASHQKRKPLKRFVNRLQRWRHGWQGHRICPVCRLWQEQEELCIAVLLDDWPKPALAEAFAASEGFCLPHTVRIATQGATHAHLPMFLAAQQQQLVMLQEELQEFVRKLDYRFAHHPYGSEADAWQRAIALFVGSRGGLESRKKP